MTKNEIIKLLGDALDKIDVLRVSPVVSIHEQKSLDDRRDRLDKMQRSLIKHLLDENTPSFKEQAKKIDAVNRRLQTAMRETDDVVHTIRSLGELVGVIDELLNLALKVAV
jgi:hypothetical protein